MWLRVLLTVVMAAFSLIRAADARVILAAASRSIETPTATLIPAPSISFPDASDSNSPAAWELVNGAPMLFVMTSAGGWPTRHQGTQVERLASAGPVVFASTAPVHGVWFEAIVPDVDGTWYGFYHNELPAEVCQDEGRMIPRIGAARSHDLGRTWEDLGIILEAPPNSHDCASTNAYFVGGVGDFSVMLDHEQKYLYFFFSQYMDRERSQGIALGRYPWADRDHPVGRMSVWWRNSIWAPSRRLRTNGETAGYLYPAGTPIYPVGNEWHDDGVVDAFWGPSVHWNTYLGDYVMLLNRAGGTAFQPNGIYIAFGESLERPETWSTPTRLLVGGRWYPQVIGLEPGRGSDRLAGERARFFMSGRSQYLIRFSR